MARVVYGNLAATNDVIAAFNSRDLVLAAMTADRFSVTLNGGPWVPALQPARAGLRPG